MQIIKFTYRLWPGWMRSITARVFDPRIEAKRFYTMEQVAKTEIEKVGSKRRYFEFTDSDGFTHQ